jgi:hypothetical protein
MLQRIDESDPYRKYNFQMPQFMRPIANTVLRNGQVQDIKDDYVRIEKLEELLRKHKENIKNERIMFMKMKSFQYEKKLKDLQNKIDKKKEERNLKNFSEHQSQINEDEDNDTTRSKGDSKKDDKINLITHFQEVNKSLNDYNYVVNEFRDIVKKYFIDADHKIELELKKYKEEVDLIEFFFNNIHLIDQEKLNKMFIVFEDRTSKYIDIISKTLLELMPFIKIITRLFDILVKKNLPIKLVKETALKICEGIHASSGSYCEAIFLNYGIDIILDLIKSSPLYRNEMCQIIFSLISNNSSSHYSVLQSLRRKFSQKDELIYYHILSKWVTNLKEENLDFAIFSFYDNAITKGINSTCDFVKIKSLNILNHFSQFDYINALKFVPKIFKHARSWNWEILSQILIYCESVLLYYNLSIEEHEKMKDSNQLDENMKNLLEENISKISQYEKEFLQVIDTIFNKKNPYITLKIGFIYLSNIIHYYPSLAEKYIKLLIEFQYNTIRKDVLEVEQQNIESEYTSSYLTEKYKICGAPLYWKPIFVTKVFIEYVKNNLKSLEEIHLGILYSIIINQDFDPAESEEWIVMYNEIRPYLYKSFANSKHTDISLSIAKKFFSFEFILEKLLESSFDSFLENLYEIYSYEMESCCENMRILLTFISESKESAKKYVYRLIKSFAIKNNELYLNSNLLDLMNRIYKEERGEIFDNLNFS